MTNHISLYTMYIKFTWSKTHSIHWFHYWIIKANFNFNKNFNRKSYPSPYLQGLYLKNQMEEEK